MAEDGQVVYKIVGDDSQLGADLDKSTDTINKKVGSWVGIATKAAGAIGAAAVAIGAAAVKVGTSFEDSLAASSTLFGDVAVNTDGLKDNLLSLSDASGIAADELGNTLYDALSSGVPVTEDMGEAMDILEKSAQLAKAGFTDIGTAMTATVKTMNAYGMSMSEADRVQKIMMQTQNLGIVTVNELGSVLAQVTPTAAAAGVSFEEVGAALALMTSQGTPASQATTQLNAAISAFLSPNTAMVDGLRSTYTEMILAGQITGQAADDFLTYSDLLAIAESKQGTFNTATKEGAAAAKDNEKNISNYKKAIAELGAEFGINVINTYGLQGALVKLNDGLGGSTNGMAKALGSSEALKASLAITGDNAGKFADNLSQMGTSADVVADAFGKITATVSEKFQKLKNELMNTLINLYEEVSPAINSALDMVTENMDVITQPLIDLAGNVVPVLLKLITSLLPPFMELAGIILPMLSDALIAIVTPIMEVAAQALPAIADAIQEVLPYLQQIGGGILEAIAAAFEIMRQPMQEIGAAVLPLIKSALETAVPLFNDLAMTVLPAVAAAFPLLADVIKAVLPSITELASTVLPALSKILSVILPVLTELAMSAMRSFADVILQMMPSIVELAETLFPVLAETIAALIPVVSEIANAVLPILTESFKLLLPPVLEMVKTLLPPMLELFSSLAPLLSELAKAVLPVIQRILGALAPLFSALISAATPLIELVITLLEPIIKLITWALEPLMWAIEPLIKGFEIFVAILTRVFEVIANIANGIVGMANTMMDNFNLAIEFIENVFAGRWGAAWQNIADAFAGIWNGITEAFKSVVNFLIDGLNKMIMGVNSIKIPDWVPLIGGKSINIPLIPRLQKGEDFVMSDWTPAYLDFGERVLTREQNIKFNSLGGLDALEASVSHKFGSVAERPMYANITLTGDLEMDGFKVGSIVLRNLDDVAAFAVRGG